MLKESKIEIIQVNEGVKVPTFEGRYFCSRKNPLKEAEVWISTHQKTLGSQDNIVILGLGAGFHIQLLQDRPNTFVIELEEELVKAWKQYNSHIQIPVQSQPFPVNAKILEFRPAWSGREAQYAELSKNLRRVTASSLKQEAESCDQWVLAEALGQASIPDSLELTIKDIVPLFPVENQTTEARLWRALRELVL